MIRCSLIFLIPQGESVNLFENKVNSILKNNFSGDTWHAGVYFARVRYKCLFWQTDPLTASTNSDL